MAVDLVRFVIPRRLLPGIFSGFLLSLLRTSSFIAVTYFLLFLFVCLFVLARSDVYCNVNIVISWITWIFIVWNCMGR